MRFVPALLLSLALCLPITAHAKGGHGGSSHAHATNSSTSASAPETPTAESNISAAARSSFQDSNPRPATDETSGACPGYVADHIQPLKGGDDDSSSNMHWQIREAAKIKNRTE